MFNANDVTRFQRGDWGFSTTSQLRFKPSRDVHRIELGPNDQAGAVVVDGLPYVNSSVIVTPDCPWRGLVPKESCTLTVTPLYTANSGAISGFQHTLDILFWHVDKADRVARAVTRATGHHTNTGSHATLLATVGRKHVQALVIIDGTGTGGDLEIYEGLFYGSSSPMSASTVKVFRRNAVATVGSYLWSPEGGQNITVDTLAAGEVGQQAVIPRPHFVEVFFSPAAGQTADVLIEAWD